MSLVFIFNKKRALLLGEQLVNDYTETNNMKSHILQSLWQKVITAKSTKNAWNCHFSHI